MVKVQRGSIVEGTLERDNMKSELDALKCNPNLPKLDGKVNSIQSKTGICVLYKTFRTNTRIFNVEMGYYYFY